jgi:hypothetical protein
MHPDKCRKMAHQCFRQADDLSSAEFRASWRMLAQSWLRMAEYIDDEPAGAVMDDLLRCLRAVSHPPHA